MLVSLSVSMAQHKRRGAVGAEPAVVGWERRSQPTRSSMAQALQHGVQCRTQTQSMEEPHMSLKAQLDGLLGAAAAKGEVPGVVAMATSREGAIYEGAFGVRAIGESAPMTADTVGLIASMTKA